MDLFVTPFSSNAFMLQALVAGILVSIACAIAGTFVILRGLAFIGDALAHGVLPGIALAILIGFPGIVGAAIGAAFMIGGITLITQRSRLSSDTAIGRTCRNPKRAGRPLLGWRLTANSTSTSAPSACSAQRSSDWISPLSGGCSRASTGAKFSTRGPGWPIPGWSRSLSPS